MMATDTRLMTHVCNHGDLAKDLIGHIDLHGRLHDGVQINATTTLMMMVINEWIG